MLSKYTDGLGLRATEGSVQTDLNKEGISELKPSKIPEIKGFWNDLIRLLLRFPEVFPEIQADFRLPALLLARKGSRDLRAESTSPWSTGNIR